MPIRVGILCYDRGMVKAFPNILLIGASHGNELLGPKLFSHLLQHRKEVLEYVDMLIGNPGHLQHISGIPNRI